MRKARGILLVFVLDAGYSLVRTRFKFLFLTMNQAGDLSGIRSIADRKIGSPLAGLAIFNRLSVMQRDL